MSTKKPGDTISFRFATRSATGAAANADSTPTAVMLRNGDVDAAVAVTVTNPATGKYKVSAAIPGTYAAGDDVQIQIDATVGGVAAVEMRNYAILDTARPGEVYTRLGAPSGASAMADLAAVKGDTGAVRTRVETGVPNAAPGTNGGAARVQDLPGNPPSVTDIAAQVRTNLTPELARIDQPISDPATLTTTERNAIRSGLAQETTAAAAVTAAQTAAAEAAAAEDSASLAALRASEAKTVATGIAADYMRRTDPVNVEVGPETVTSIATETAAQVGDGLVDALQAPGTMLASINARLTTTRITITSPVYDAGRRLITLFRGFDYYAVESQSVDLTLEGRPDLTGAEIVLERANGTDVATGSVVTAGDGIDQVVRFEFSKEETAALPLGEIPCRIRALMPTEGDAEPHEIMTAEVTLLTR